MTRPFHARALAGGLGVSAAALVLAACDGGPGIDSSAGGTDRGDAAAGSPWRRGEDGSMIAVDRASQDAVNAAIDEARRTADSARARWHAASEEQKLHWAVKWAAATESGGVEYVWVRPAHWSAFRIEGALLNQPATPLAQGRAMGDAVGFPIEDLADWMYESRDEQTGEIVRLGGFTVDVLMKEYGAPPSN